MFLKQVSCYSLQFAGNIQFNEQHFSRAAWGCLSINNHAVVLFPYKKITVIIPYSYHPCHPIVNQVLPMHQKLLDVVVEESKLDHLVHEWTSSAINEGYIKGRSNIISISPLNKYGFQPSAPPGLPQSEDPIFFSRPV